MKFYVPFDQMAQHLNDLKRRRKRPAAVILVKAQIVVEAVLLESTAQLHHMENQA